MSGETENSVSGWTVDTLRAHIETQLTDLKILLDERQVAATTGVTAALAAAEKAVLKAEVASDKRFESVNEFREQLRDQALLFMPRTEAQGLTDRNAERTDELRDRVSKIENGEKGVAQGRATTIAFGGFILSLILIVSVGAALWRS